jgi:hypothetical protein
MDQKDYFSREDTQKKRNKKVKDRKGNIWIGTVG